MNMCLILTEQTIQFIFKLKENKSVPTYTFLVTLKSECAMENSDEYKPNLSKRPKARVKIFQLSQKKFAAAGIDPSLVTQPYPFNRKISLNFLALLVSVICNLMHTFYEAKTFAEHLQSLYMCSLTISIILALVIVLLNVAKLFNFIEISENLVNKSEFKSNPDGRVLIIMKTLLFSFQIHGLG